MPRLRQTALGSGWEATPFDAAEAYNAQQRDAWNMAQHQDNWQQDRADRAEEGATQRHRESLNFGAWQTGQQGAQSAAALAAQERLARMGLDQQGLMFDKRSALDDARDARNWDRQQNDPFRRAQIESLDMGMADTRERRARNAAVTRHASTPEGMKLLQAGDQLGFMRLVAGDGTSLDPDLLLQIADRVAARKDAAADARLAEVSAGLGGTDPVQRKWAEEQLAADPLLASQVHRPRRQELAVDPADTKTDRLLNAAVDGGIIAQTLAPMGRNRMAGVKTEQTEQDVAALRQAIDSEAARISKDTGYGVESIRAELIRRLRDMDHTGGGATLLRVLAGLSSFGLSEAGVFDDDLRSERAAAVENAIKSYGVR